MSNNSKVLVALIVLVLSVISIIGFPILYIWCLNTLFPVLAIPYTFSTWFAMVVVKVFLMGGAATAKISSSIDKLKKQ